MKERHFTVQVSICDDPESSNRYAAKHAILEDLPEQGDQELIDNSCHYNESASDVSDLLSSVLDNAADRIAEKFDEDEEEDDGDEEIERLARESYESNLNLDWPKDPSWHELTEEERNTHRARIIRQQNEEARQLAEAIDLSAQEEYDSCRAADPIAYGPWAHASETVKNFFRKKAAARIEDEQ